jgi:hypothetical protein
MYREKTLRAHLKMPRKTEACSSSANAYSYSMAAYFQKSPWTPFVHVGITYDLSHLEEYEFDITDTDEKQRRIAVTFSDHCFTRSYKAQDLPTRFYPGSTRNPGVFCFDRYRYSLGIVRHIAYASTRKVWNAASNDDVFAIVPFINHEGKEVHYAIVFSLERVKGLPVDLHMRIKTAHPRDETGIETFGEVRFRHLVALRMQRKSPGRITDHIRKRP